MKKTWTRPLFVILLALGPLLMFSCITDKPKDETSLTFALDTAKFGKFDSLRIVIFAPNDSVNPVQSSVIVTPKGTRLIQVKLSDQVPADFFVVVTGYDSGAIAYRKLYNYQDGAPDSSKPAVRISSIKGAALTLDLGESKPAVLTFTPADAPAEPIVLASGDTTLVKVTGAAGDSLMALRFGSTTVKASTRDGAVKTSFTVTVTALVKEIRVDRQALAVGDTLRPSVTVLPASAANKDYAFSLLDTGIVSVAGKSLIGLKAGVARVIAASVDFGARDTFVVTVRIPVEGITAQDIAGVIGDVFAPDISWQPPDATDRGYTLRSKDSALVKVDGDSLRLLAAGGDSVFVTSRDGGFHAGFKVDVSNRVYHPDSLRAADKRMLVEDTLAPTLDWFPATTTDKDYSLRSLDTTIVVVAGRTFISRKLGMADLVVTSHDGGLKDTFTVTVSPPAFTTDILPITTSKCGPCHIVGTTFNWQDSASLVMKGASALDRLTRPDNATGKMPLAGASGGPITARELAVLLDWLGREVKPLTSYAVKDTSVAFGDTLRPVIAFTPPDASNRLVTFTSVDTGIVAVRGGTLLLPKSMGQVTLIAESDETKAKLNFKVTVTAPDFARNVLPITSFKCAPCHDPGTTFNWRDSTELLSNGASALDRLTRTAGTVGRMPLAGAQNGDLTAPQLAVLLGWLNSKFVALKGITVPTADTVKLGARKAPAIVWDPVGATGKAYTLLSSDTSKVGVAGDSFVGKALGTANVEVRTKEGNFTKTFSVLVLPVRVDSIAVHDTGGFIGDTVRIRAAFFPANATDRNYSVSAYGLTPTHVTFKDSITVVCQSLGSDSLLMTSKDGSKTKVIKFTVAPILPTGVSAKDTNGVVDQLVTPTVSFLPATTTDKTFRLKSADTNVAVVVGSQVKGKTVGNTDVTVTSVSDSSRTAVFKYTIGPVLVDSIKTLPLTLQIHATVSAKNFITWFPTNATNKNFKVTPTDTSKADAVGDTAVIGKKRPSTTVTITSSDGSKLATWNVTVVQAKFFGAPVSAVLNRKCTVCHYAGNPQLIPDWNDSSAVALKRNLIADRITRTNGTQMPPAGSLPQAEIDTLLEWMSQ